MLEAGELSQYNVWLQTGIPRFDPRQRQWGSLCVQISSKSHPTSYPIDTGGSFPEGKAQRGRDADHLCPSSAWVKNEYELYLLSPLSPSWL
jgi:hypothetical protein